MAEAVTVNWSVYLFCRCPKCGDDRDLTDDPDFWTEGNGQDLAIAEQAAFDEECPRCGHSFTVQLEW